MKDAPTKPTKGGSEFELLPVELHMCRNQIAILDMLCGHLAMSREQVLRWAVVEFSRRPAFDELFPHRVEVKGHTGRSDED